MFWKPIPGLGIYEASRKGQIRNSKTKRIRKLSPNAWGHLVVSVSHNGYVKSYQVHRLIALTFIESNGKPFVLHSDGNPKNNSVKNLRWGTHKENMADRTKHGKSRPRKLSLKQVKEIKTLLREELSLVHIAKQFDITHSTVSLIKTGKHWSAKLGEQNA